MGAYTRAIRASHRIHGSFHLEIFTASKDRVLVDKVNKTMSAEIAEINHGRMDPLAFNHVWNFRDGAEKGFIMKSNVTGERALFILKEVKTDADGDIQAWEFTPYKEPKLEGWKFVIFND